MKDQQVIFEDLGKMAYQQAWDYQESLLQENLRIKSEARNQLTIDSLQLTVDNHEPEITAVNPSAFAQGHLPTINHLLFVEHDPVYTLGKSGHLENLLLEESAMKSKGIQFFKTNRGGDITFHGPGQIVGYPILDLEKFGTDIGKYLRRLEDVIILTLAAYNIKGGRSAGETGVWIEPGIAGKERKICAIGVRCSRWITMHGFAFNVNTDLSYFNHIIPCGIQNKQVSSLEKELGHKISMEEVKQKVKQCFEEVFDAELIG
jgi:lipoyl(octanoyl) transferase